MREEYEVRVRPVTRYVVTIYESGTTLGGRSYSQCDMIGMFDNEHNAETVAMALREAERRGVKLLVK